MPVPVMGPLDIYILPSSINVSSIAITVDSSSDTFNSSISGEYLLLVTHGDYNWNDTHTVSVSCDGYSTTSGTTDSNGKVYITLTAVQYISKLSDGTNTYTIKDAEARNSLTGKQDTLVSGTNIKTINNNSILGSGNISVETSIDNTTITKNGNNNLQSVATIDNRSGNAIKTWTGTRAQYDAIITKDSNTLYNITDDTNITLTLLEALYPVGSIYITTNDTCPLSIILSNSSWTLVSSGKVLQGADNDHAAGTMIEAGLPNITGEFAVRRQNNAGTLTYYSGVFYDGGLQGESNSIYYSTDTSSQQQRVKIDASRSSSIYGNSNTVQPPAYVVNIWKRIA